MNKLISPAVPLALALSTFYMVANAADWPRWRGPDADGISNEEGWLAKWPQEGPKRLWKTSVGTGFSSVAVGKGKVYTMGNDGKSTDTIYCLDADTGKAIWTRQYDAPLDPNMYEGGPNATPTLDSDRVYTLGKRGQVFCLNATNGEVIWNKDLMKDWGQEPPTWGFAGSPAVDGGLVLLNSGGAGLALKKDTGEAAWKSGGKKPGYSTPLAVDWKGKRTVFLMTARALAGVRESDGSVLWSYPWKTSYDMNIADPIFNEGKVFISSGYDHGCALVDLTGSEPNLVWENKNLRNHFSSSLLWKGFLYGVDDANEGHEFRCVSWETGEVKWSHPFGRGAMMMAGGKIIALNEQGELYVIEPSPEAFKAVSHAQVLGGRCWTAPVLSDGRIYCRNAKGDLVCLDVGGK